MGFTLNLSGSGIHPDDAKEVYENLVRAFRDIADDGAVIAGTLDAAEDTPSDPPEPPIHLDAKDILDVTDPADPAADPGTDA